MTLKKFKLVELFAGTGAFSLAFENTNNFETIFANDICKNSEIIYNNNFKLKLNTEDINTLNISEIPSMDILTAGFPCQPFSIAGKQQGFKDNRTNVFWKIIEIIDKHKPSIVIFENVKNLQSHDNGNTLRIILSQIDKLKYFYKYKILNTCNYTYIPQNRERIYIICFKNICLYNKFNFPDQTNQCLPLKKFLENTIPNKYYYTNLSKIWDKIKNINKKIDDNVIYQYRRYYIRENKHNLCPTLTANMGTGGHNVPILMETNGNIRKLTPRECFNFQGFPNTYKLPSNISDSGLYKLAGNAVTYSIVEKIAQIIYEILQN